MCWFIFFSIFGICILVLFVRLFSFAYQGVCIVLQNIFLYYFVYTDSMFLFFKILTQITNCLHVLLLFHKLQNDSRKSRNGGQSVLQVRAEKYILKIINFFIYIFIFYCYSITVVCIFSPSLHPTPAKPTSFPRLHPPPWFC